MAEKKSATKSAQVQGASRSAFMAPLTPDAALAEIVGRDPIPRTEVIKRVWDYIRENNLQDPNDKRTIRADAKLKQVLDGKDSVTMFELTKMVNGHLYKDISPSRLPGNPVIRYSGGALDGDPFSEYVDPKGGKK